jgi:hypothetical protein
VASINSTTGEFEFAPQSIGTYYVRVIATDLGGLTVNQDVSFTVTPATPTVSVTDAGGTYRFVPVSEPRRGKVFREGGIQIPAIYLIIGRFEPIEDAEQKHEDPVPHLIRHGEDPQGPSHVFKRVPVKGINCFPVLVRRHYDEPQHLLFISQFLQVVPEGKSRPGAQVILKNRGLILHALPRPATKATHLAAWARSYRNRMNSAVEFRFPTFEE